MEGLRHAPAYPHRRRCPPCPVRSRVAAPRSRHLQGTPWDRVWGMISHTSAQQWASTSSPVSQQEHGAGGQAARSSCTLPDPLLGPGAACLVHCLSPALPPRLELQTKLICFLTLRSFTWRFIGFCAQGTLQRSHPRCRPQALNSPRPAVPHVLPLFATVEVPKSVVDGFSLAGFPPGGRGTGDAAGRGTGDAAGSGGTGLPPWLMRTADASVAADSCRAPVLA